MTGEVAHATVAVVNARGGGFADHLYIRASIDAAVDHHARVAWGLLGAVAVDAAQVGGDEQVAEQVGGGAGGELPGGRGLVYLIVMRSEIEAEAEASNIVPTTGQQMESNIICSQFRDLI